MRENFYLFGFLLTSALLLFLGRNELPFSVLVNWGLVFGTTTAIGILLVSLFRVREELKASRHELAEKDAELSFAREVQKSLFPRQLPAEIGLEFAALCIPARGISGDYYDVLPRSDGRVVFAIADISGKGISAAILMANLHALLRVVAETGVSPAEICRRLNVHLYRVTEPSRFATFVIAEWDPGHHTITYSNAGHHPPMRIRPGRIERLEQGGVPLGMFENSEFDQGQIQLEAEDLLVLYSDGITEAESPAGEHFGEERLASLAESLHSLPLLEIQAQLLQRVQAWTRREPEDDTTLMLVRPRSK